MAEAGVALRALARPQRYHLQIAIGDRADVRRGERQQPLVLNPVDESEVGKAVYANCITLTPGTYCIDINSAVIEVHSLTKNLAHNLQQGEMNKRILALESTSAKTSKL